MPTINQPTKKLKVLNAFSCEEPLPDEAPVQLPQMRGVHQGSMTMIERIKNLFADVIVFFVYLYCYAWAVNNVYKSINWWVPPSKKRALIQVNIL